MGRRFPVGQNYASNHPFISLSLFIACIAATIAIFSSLCGALPWKKSKPSPAAKNDTEENRDGNISSAEGSPEKDTTLVPPSAATVESGNRVDVGQPQDDEELLQQPLPPPPGRRHLSCAASYHYRSDSTASQTTLPSSMSMRVMGNGMASRQASKREDNDKKKEKKLKHDDSIWKKTIILGEKCKVPDGDDDTILYDEKGNRISTYHPKGTNSFALSRQSSFIEQEALPS